MRQEQQPHRSDKQDLRIHACLYFIKPGTTSVSAVGTFSERKLINSVKPLDVEVMKRLGTRVNLIPVIAKADTMTQEDLHNFKYIVRISAGSSATLS
jgi:cell division control protein 12